MDIEKLVNSRVYSFFDWIWRLVILNILTLITSLGIITILPSFTACYKTITTFQEGSSQNVFTVYFSNLKRYFIEPLKGNVLILGATIIFVIAIVYYLSNSGGEGVLATISTVGFYFVLFLVLILLVMFIQLPMIYTQFYFRYFDYFRFAFIIAFRNIILSIAYLGSFALCGLLFIYFLPGWLMCGISLPIFIGNLLFKKTYWKLINENKINEEKENEIRD